MDEIFLVISILSLACYIILTNGKAGAKTIVRNAYARFPENIPYMSEYLEANAGIYVHQFVFGSFAKLQFKIFVIGGWACLPIAIYSIYNYGLLNILSCISALTFLLKICTDTESFYSYNLSPQLLTQNTIKRLKNHFPTGIPSVIYEKLPQYDNVACMIMSNAFPNQEITKQATDKQVTNNSTIPINLSTPLRTSLKLSAKPIPDTQAKKLIVTLMKPLAYFGVPNIKDADKINSDETLIKVASVYYNILLGYAMDKCYYNNDYYNNIIPTIRQSLKEFNAIASHTTGMSYDKIVELQTPELLKMGWILPDFQDIIDLVTFDILNYSYDDDNMSQADKRSLNEIKYYMNKWSVANLPNIYKTIDDYANIKSRK